MGDGDFSFLGGDLTPAVSLSCEASLFSTSDSELAEADSDELFDTLTFYNKIISRSNYFETFENKKVISFTFFVRFFLRSWEPPFFLPPQSESDPDFGDCDASLSGFFFFFESDSSS